MTNITAGSADRAEHEATTPFQTTPLAELEHRASRLQALMREAGVDGVLATQNADVFYLSGAIQQAQVYLPVSGKPLLMVRKHHERARTLTALPPENVVPVRSLRELPQLMESVGQAPKRLGFEWDTLPVATFQAYSKAIAPLGAELVDASMLFRQVRAIKSEFELAQIRRAAEVSDAIIKAAAEHAHAGMTEVELSALIEAAARVAGHSGTFRMRFFGQEMHMGHLLGGESGAVPSFMNSPTGGTGVGPWAPYGPGTRPLRRAEPILVDFVGEWGGYISDQTRMLSLGPLPQFWLDAYAAMRDVEDYIVRIARPGMTAGDFYDLCLQRATELGYGDNFMGPPEEESPGQKVYFVGHGVGLELDEWPPLQRGFDAELLSEMVLAVEPKLLYKGRGAIGIEDTYVLRDTGLERLTISTQDIFVV